MKHEPEDKTWSQEVFIPARVPDEYKQAAYEHLQHAFGKKVFSILYQSRLPAVIDFKEETIPVYDNYEPGERVRYTLMINPVDHHHITMTHFEPSNIQLVRSATEEIKRRIARKIKGIFHRKEMAR